LVHFSSVVEVRDVSDDVMVSLIKNSKGVLFPSFVEGWGMPLVEAMVMNVPVLASDIPALREAGQGLAEYIDPTDTISWRNAIEKLCNDKTYSEELIERISQFSPPSWVTTFMEFDELLNQNIKTVTARDVSRAGRALGSFHSSLAIEEESQVSSPRIIANLSDKIIARLTPQSRRKIRKFFNNPRAFFQDSKKPAVKKLGGFLMRI
jgi:glycosyltransferase involved in cell wall biosynthesis